MSKFIQTYFFHPSTFLFPTKQKGEKIKSFLFSHFSILPPFSSWINTCLYRIQDICSGKLTDLLHLQLITYTL